MFGVLGGLAATGIWYVLVLFVIPSQRLEQIFLQRGLINIIITFVGFLGLASIVQEFLKNQNLQQEINSYISRFKINTPSIARIRETIDFLQDKVKKGYKYVSFFSGLCVSLGFLGTVIGIAGGIGSLSNVFADANDFSKVKDSIFTLISNLGVAFDSTLLGLIFSIIISVAVSICLRLNLKTISDGMDAFLEKAIKEGSASDGIVSNPVPAASNAIPSIQDVNLGNLNQYLKTMSLLGNKLATLMEIQKKVADQVPSMNFADLKEGINNTNSILDKIFNIIRQGQRPKTFRIVEEIRPKEQQ